MPRRRRHVRVPLGFEYQQGYRVADEAGSSRKTCVGYHVRVSLLVPLITWPVLSVSIGLVITSVILALFILLHKGKGGGMSDLFGGGMSTAMGGTSVAERNLDRITIIVGSLWLACIVALLIMYRFGV